MGLIDSSMSSVNREREKGKERGHERSHHPAATEIITFDSFRSGHCFHFANTLIYHHYNCSIFLSTVNCNMFKHCRTAGFVFSCNALLYCAVSFTAISCTGCAEEPTTNKHVSSVTTMRVIDVFVSRLHPMTAKADVKECVKTIGQDSNIAISHIQCNKLKARYEHLYSSVHVEIQVNAADMSRELEVFMKTYSWPVGVFVRRYFKPKPVNGESE